MSEIFKNSSFWLFATVALATIILLILTFAGKIKNGKIKVGDNELSFGGIEKNKKNKQTINNANSFNNVTDLVISIIEEDNRLNQEIDNVKQSCLDEQMSFARKRLSSLSNDVYEDYRKRSSNDNISVMVFGLMFNKDYGSEIVDNVFDIIRRNHLAEKTDENLREYLRVAAVSEISNLRQKCIAYSTPIDQKIVEEVFDSNKDKIFRGIESSVENARYESSIKNQKIANLKEKSIEIKKCLIKAYFPNMSDEDIKQRLSGKL